MKFLAVVPLRARHNNKPIPLSPSFVEENRLGAQGCRFIAGVDEVGRGALAGPVVAAAVILPQSADFPWLKSVRDSKEISPAKRESLFSLITNEAISVGIGIVDHHIIDSIGILKATRLAMCQAVEQLAHTPDFLLIDFLTLPQLKIAQKPIVRGDKACLSIACASIVAKITRDRIMVELDKIHPGYGFARHKGYCTREHLNCLRQFGPSPVHRHYFTPVRDTIRLL